MRDESHAMNAGSYKRKISAIWSADVVGYSRLMGGDEEETVRTLTRHRTVMADLIRQYRGRVVDSPGDNLLAELPSVVDALRCAWDVQQELSNTVFSYKGKTMEIKKVGQELDVR